MSRVAYLFAVVVAVVLAIGGVVVVVVAIAIAVVIASGVVVVMAINGARGVVVVAIDVAIDMVVFARNGSGSGSGIVVDVGVDIVVADGIVDLIGKSGLGFREDVIKTAHGSNGTVNCNRAAVSAFSCVSLMKYIKNEASEDGYLDRKYPEGCRRSSRSGGHARGEC